MHDAIPVDRVAASSVTYPITQVTLPTLFGSKLRHLRQQHHLSQIELAQLLGLAAHAHISLLERGRHEPSIDLVIAIAEHFGVTTDYLLWDEIAIDG